MPKTESKVAKALKKRKERKELEKTPLWKGPEEDGVTQSLLSSFLCCRERFRIKTILGLAPTEQFSHRLEYGSMWHVCEEEHSAGNDFEPALLEYCSLLAQKFNTQATEIRKWYNVCRRQFPLYIEYWENNEDESEKEVVEQEQEFKVPYELPSGRTVYLRGKRDAVYAIGKELYLKENKTKGDINEEALRQQLSSGFDLQTMFYLTALEYDAEFWGNTTTEGILSGVIYNVVRRPLSGGKGTIRQHKPTKKNPAGETLDHFYGRLADYIIDDPGYFFMRWKVSISERDIERFKKQCLNPILEQLCDWYLWVTYTGEEVNSDPFDTDKQYTVQYPSGEKRVLGHWDHFRFPYGVYNPMTEGRTSDIDSYLRDGSEVGLRRVETLFPELG